jgi:HJR/Mrr/RecB family endonuclease
MSEIQQPREPRPEEFGIAAARVKHFRRILEDDPVAIAAFGLPIIAVTIIALNWLLPRSLVNAIAPIWRLLLPIIPASYLIGAIHRQRKSTARKQLDYPMFSSYQGAIQRFENAMKTYRYLQRKERHDQLKKKRHQASQVSTQNRAKWRDIDGRGFEIEVVKILFSKGYDVTHTGGSRSGDEGVDFTLRIDSRRIIGQCKAHKSYLSAGFVRELYGTLLHEKADEAWLVCTTGFYSGAITFAFEKPIRLLTIEDLLRLPDIQKGISKTTGEPNGASNRSQPCRPE